MKNIIILLTGLLCAFATSAQTLSPEVVATGGEQFSNGTTQLNWTLGETMTETVTANNQLLTQGFHQPAYLITALEPPATQLDIKMTAYPNPAIDQVTLAITREGTHILTATLIDLHGRQLQEKSTALPQAELTFDLTQLAQSTYFLVVNLPTEGYSQHFKISKIQ